MRRTLSFILLFVMLAGAFAITVNAKQFDYDNFPDKLTIAVNNVFPMDIYRSVMVDGKVEIDRINGKCDFYIADESVATVTNDGVIKTHKIGSTKLTVDYETSTREVEIDVTKADSTPIAHRGAMDYAPENTQASFKKAVELGYRYMEADMRLGGDGNIFVLHNEDTEKMCGQKVKVSEITLANRANYPITTGTGLSKYATQYIPTLDEVLDIVKSSKTIDKIYLHVKEKFTQTYVDLIQNKIRDKGLSDRVILICSYKTTLAKFDNSFEKGYLTQSRDMDFLLSTVDWAKENGIKNLLYCYQEDFLPPAEFVLKAHENGLNFICYTVGLEWKFEQVRESGADAVFCNKVFFKLDKSLINCSISILNPDKTEHEGGIYKVIDENGKTAAAFDKGSKAEIVSGKLESGKTYSLVQLETEDDFVLPESTAFVIKNTNNVQKFSFNLIDPNAPTEPATEDPSTEPTTEAPVTEPATEVPSTEPATIATEPATEPVTEPIIEPLDLAKLNKTSATLKAGKTLSLSVENGEVKSWKSSKKTVATVKDGKVTALRKGSAEITATLSTGRKLTCKLTVSSNPSIKIGGKKFKTTKTYPVKKGGFLSIQITGKASSVKNSYSSSKKKIAKITSKKTASKLKLKGYKKGKTNVALTVNGVKYKIKIQVK